MEMTELKPCPFCGAEANAYQVEDWYAVYCENRPDCRASVGEFDSEEQAIAAWNRRTEQLQLAFVAGERDGYKDRVKEARKVLRDILLAYEDSDPNCVSRNLSQLRKLAHGGDE